jgi:hypothetical protein
MEFGDYISGETLAQEFRKGNSITDAEAIKLGDYECYFRVEKVD